MILGARKSRYFFEEHNHFLVVMQTSLAQELTPCVRTIFEVTECNIVDVGSFYCCVILDTIEVNLVFGVYWFFDVHRTRQFCPGNFAL